MQQRNRERNVSNIYLSQVKEMCRMWHINQLAGIFCLFSREVIVSSFHRWKWLRPCYYTSGLCFAVELLHTLECGTVISQQEKASAGIAYLLYLVWEEFVAFHTVKTHGDQPVLLDWLDDWEIIFSSHIMFFRCSFLSAIAPELLWALDWVCCLR